MKKIYCMIGVVLLGLAGCSSSADYADWNALDGEWNVLRVGDYVVDIPGYENPDEVPFIGFQPEDGSVYGLLGCNRLVGVRIIDAKHPQVADFSNLGSTLMLCEDMKVEDKLLPALRSVVHYQIAPNGYLQLLDAEGAVVIELQKR